MPDSRCPPPTALPVALAGPWVPVWLHPVIGPWGCQCTAQHWHWVTVRCTVGVPSCTPGRALAPTALRASRRAGTPTGGAGTWVGARATSSSAGGASSQPASGRKSKLQHRRDGRRSYINIMRAGDRGTESIGNGVCYPMILRQFKRSTWRSCVAGSCFVLMRRRRTSRARHGLPGLLALRAQRPQAPVSVRRLGRLARRWSWTNPRPAALFRPALLCSAEHASLREQDLS